MARVNTRTPMSTKKKAASITAIVLCMALLLGGAFAWKDFSQAFTNIFKQHPTPDVLLHDDFTPGENKDVYVENTGDVPTYVRISFYEFLQIGNEVVVGDTTKTPAESLKDKSTWKKHLYTTMPAADGKVSDWNLESDKYYDWFMTGAQKLYLPGTSEIEDINYTALGYAAGNIPAKDDGKANSGNGYALKNTAAATPVISMATWKGMSDAVQSQYKGWILDTDGYAYWSQKLLPGEATNLLLDNVLPKPGAIMDDNAYYAIDVRLQATNATEVYKMFTDKDTGATDITNDAKDWLDGDADKKVPENIIDDPKGTGLTEEEKDDFRTHITAKPINTAGIKDDCGINTEKDVADAYAIALEELNKAIVGGDAAKAEELARAAESLKNIASRIRNKYPTTGELDSGEVITVDENGFAKAVDEATGDTLINPINFPDPELVKILKNGFTTAKREFVTPGNYTSNTTWVVYSQPILGDGSKIAQSEMNDVEELILNNIEWDGSAFVTGKINISSLKGIELFPNLEILQATENRSLTSYDAPLNPKLKWLQVSTTNLSEINIQKCPDLEVLLLAANPNLTKVDVSKNTALKWMNLTDCNITGALDLSNLAAVKTVTVFNNPNITSIDLSGCIALGNLQTYNTGIDKLDISGLTSLSWVATRDCPNLTSIDASGCSALTTILAYWSNHQNGANHGPLQSIDLTGCTSLTVANSGQMQVHGQSLTELDISMTDFASGGNHARFQYNNISKLTVKTGTAAAWAGTTGNNNTYHKLGNPYTAADVTVTP